MYTITITITAEMNDEFEVYEISFGSHSNGILCEAIPKLTFQLYK